MTHTTVISRRNMIHLLVGCDTGVMTYIAVAIVYTQMIKGDTGKADKISGRMTGRAI